MARIKPECTRAGGKWTEAKFWSFIRSSLRKRFMVWPPNSQCRNAARRPYVGDNPRQKYEYQCAHCKEWKMGKETQVHHKVECGSLKTLADIAGFVDRLFCEAKDLELVCIPCHKKEHHPTL
jgi:hypothetical protein